MSGFHINNSPEAIAAFMAEQRKSAANLTEYQRDVLAALGRIEALLTSAFNGGTAVVTEADGPLATTKSEIRALREEVAALRAGQAAYRAEAAERDKRLFISARRSDEMLSRVFRDTDSLTAEGPATPDARPENA